MEFPSSKGIFGGISTVLEGLHVAYIERFESGAYSRGGGGGGGVFFFPKFWPDHHLFSTFAVSVLTQKKTEGAEGKGALTGVFQTLADRRGAYSMIYGIPLKGPK